MILVETPPNEMHALKIGKKGINLLFLQLEKEEEKIMKMIHIDLNQH